MLFLIVMAVAWVMAHVVKYFIFKIRKESKPLRQLFDPGGMPSAHTATFASLTTCVGMVCGINTVYFALSAALTLVVAYDAMNVRRATGENGDAIRVLAHENSKIKLPHIARGHTPSEVFVGGALGLAIGAICYFALFPLIPPVGF